MIRTTNILKNQFYGKMSVFEYTKFTSSGKTSLKKTLVLDNIPCLLTSMVSRRSAARDTQNGFVNRLDHVKKLFLPNEYVINTGSSIEISQDGRLYSFEYSGEAFIYQTHQEIILENEIIA